MKKSKFITKLFISLISAVLSVSLIVPVHLKAEVDYSDICDLILKKQHVFLSPELISDALTGDIWGIFQDIYNGTISYKTWKDTTHACEVDPDGGHGGHGGSLPSNNKVWYTVLNDTENDLKNGSNYNYYTNSNYSTTNNYSVVNTTTNNISYNYENTAYNYYYDVNNSYYDIENNTYNYYLSQNNYLTTVNNYNNTTIIDNGSTRVLYYRLPDGSNSLNMTEEIALNGYKTSLSVRSYENTYDSDDLVALYHFDGNELDSAYPTQTSLDFTRNSIQYIGSTTPFNESLSLYGESVISVNKSNKFISFRFNPIFNQNWSLSINGSDLGEAVLDYETFSHYDEYLNNYYTLANSFLQIYYVTDSLYFGYYASGYNSTGYSGTSSIIFGSSIEKVIEAYNSNLAPSRVANYYIFNNPQKYDNFTGATYHITNQTVINNFYNPENIDLSPYEVSDGYSFYPTVQYYSQNYSSSQKVSNRSYNYVNQFYIDTYSAVDLVNFNMWNYLTVNIDGSVYINGNDTGIDVDNSQNLSIEIGGDSVTYIDELALFNSNHNNYSPFYPYSSNIVYSVPEYYDYLEIPGIKLNNYVSNNTNSYSILNIFNFSINNNSFKFDIDNGPDYVGLAQGNVYNLNHIYYVYVDPDDNNDYSEISRFIFPFNKDYLSINNNKFSYLSSDNINNKNNQFYLLFYNRSSSFNTSLEFFVQVIDLTLMFGSGYEPNKEWCDQYLDDYIAYNVNPDVTESPYNIETGYIYLKQVPTGLAKNNEILIQSIIPVNSWKIGGYRSSDPSNGDVFANVDDLGYITSVQQYNGLDWVEVTAGLYNEYLGMWISALGFNIFNQNWEYTEYKYLNDGGSDSWLVRFLSDKFRNTDNILTNILERVGLINPNIQINQELNNDYNNVINNYNINPYDELNNRFNDIQELDNQIDLTAPDYNIDSESLLQAHELKQIPEAIVDGFSDLKIGYLLFIPLIIGIVRLIL